MTTAKKQLHFSSSTYPPIPAKRQHSFLSSGLDEVQMPLCSCVPYEVVKLFRRQKCCWENEMQSSWATVIKVAHIFIFKYLLFCESSNHKRHEQNFLIILDTSSEICNIILLLTKLPHVPQGLTLHSVRECSSSRKINYQEPRSAHARTSYNVL